MNEFECIRQETCSSQEPEMIYDVAIIGAGPGGIFSALELTQQAPELKIAVLEKGSALKGRRCPIDGEKIKSCIGCRSRQSCMKGSWRLYLTLRVFPGIIIQAFFWTDARHRQKNRKRKSENERI